MTPLQERAVYWHCERYPWADRFHLLAKLTEETGEVARAMYGELEDRVRGDVVHEAAQVVLVLLSLTGRYYYADLLAVVEAELARQEANL